MPKFTDVDLDFDFSIVRDNDDLLAVEAFDELAALEAELVELGTIGGRGQRADGVPAAEAVWRVVPEGTRVGGTVWNLFWRGVRQAYAER